MKILLIRLSSIGDCVMASPVVAALLEAHPGAHITWVVQSKSVAAVRGLPGVSEVLEWDKKRKGALGEILKSLWRGRYDAAIDLQGLDKAALFLLASRAKIRVSGSSSRRIARLVSTVCVPENGQIHARDYSLGRAAPLGIAPDAKERFFPVLPVTPAHHEGAARWLRENGGENGPLIGLNLGASHHEKRWPTDYFARLAHSLLEDSHRGGENLRVAVFGAPGDFPLWQEFEAEFEKHSGGKNAHPRLFCLVGKTDLLEMAALTARCAVFVSADTGPMHVAAAMGAPLLALLGPTRAWRTAPIQNPRGAPIRVLDAATMTGSWPAPMTTHSVESVEKAVREILISAPKNEVGR